MYLSRTCLLVLSFLKHKKCGQKPLLSHFFPYCVRLLTQIIRKQFLRSTFSQRKQCSQVQEVYGPTIVWVNKRTISYQKVAILKKKQTSGSWKMGKCSLITLLAHFITKLIKWKSKLEMSM